jgi:hypothetical protein
MESWIILELYGIISNNLEYFWAIFGVYGFFWDIVGLFCTIIFGILSSFNLESLKKWRFCVQIYQFC